MRLILLTAAVALLSACHPHRNEATAATNTPSPDTSGIKGVHRVFAGTPMPAAELKDANDADSTLADSARGKPLLVNLWASWCVPCVKELPTLQALSRRAGAPRLIAVSEDDAPRGSVDAFLDQHRSGSIEVWRDPAMALSGALNAQVLPTTIYYGSDGKEKWRFVGDMDWTSARAAGLIAER